MTDFVFLHGGGQGSWIWDETLAALQMQSGGAAVCVALDVPGCGTRRGRDTSGISFDDIVNELASDISAAGLSRPVLVGHSQAGQIMPRLEALTPGAFARHIYVTCIAQSPGHTIDDTMRVQMESDPQGPLAGALGDPDMDALERFRIMFVNDMPRRDQDVFLARLLRDNWPASAYSEKGWAYDQLASVPCTYVHCMQDQVLPPDWQRTYAERFRCERTVHIDAAHQVQNARPHALAEVLLCEAVH